MPCNCSENLWKMGPYVDGELDPGERAGLEASLRECAECRQALESFRQMDELAAREPVPSVSSTEWAGVLASIKSQPRVVSEPARSSGIEWLAPLAAIAALLLIGLFLGGSLLHDDPGLDGAGSGDRASVDDEPNGLLDADDLPQVDSGGDAESDERLFEDELENKADRIDSPGSR